ncbi:MAG: glycosyl hydrolase family 28-related protein [Balneolaceae bacterium]|nr:glycosyl hydrolase family 28-related protein [Balneolaceae bacterium]
MVSRLLKIFIPLLLAFLFVGCSTENSPQDSDYFKPVPASFYEDLSFDMPRVPVPEFPDYSVSIEEFGAVGDGAALNTEAIRKAIEDVAEQGGGRVVIPKGIWLTVSH